MIIPSTTSRATSFDNDVLALPFFEARHVEFAHRIGAWCERSGALWARADDPHGSAVEEIGRRILRALGDDGWLAHLDPGSPEADQSSVSGGDFRSLCLAREALAYTDDLADFSFSIQALAATPIQRYGSEAQRIRYLPGMAAGRLIGSFAVSEREAGSDLAAIGLQAERVADGYLLSGEKAWVAHASIADVHCVIARTGEGPGVLGLTAFLLPAGTPGLRVRPVSMTAPRALGDLVLDGCRLPADSVLGRPGRGFVVAADLLERFRMTAGAAAVGFARRAADAALARARSRPMLGGRLFDLPTIKATLAEMEVEVSAAALLVARAAWEIDNGNRRFQKHSSIAKLHATETAQRVVDACVQIHGAAGLVHGSLPERLYRQVRSLRIYEGSSEVQKTIIAVALDPRRADRPGLLPTRPEEP